ncbi:MAG: hypothetical protein HUU37_08005 [Bdellovibrionales bacterium]|nr:hypothetical protein [Bdellovibrionales bacterium]
MCGFLGVYGNYTERDVPHFREHASLLRHRGGTGYGELLDPLAALFHHRLAFRDLKDGLQPMASSCGKALIVFNGELYGFQALRSRLAHGYDFRNRSDTEVILAAHLADPEGVLRELDGEYAFALWRRDTKELWAARDFFGVKPLFLANETISRLGEDFFRQSQDRWSFSLQGPIHLASEMKGLPVELRWNRRGLLRQLIGLYEESATAFENVMALPPGALLQATRRGNSWDCVLTRKIEARPPTRQGFHESARELRRLVEENVTRKLDSEVPLGVYLSGGVDSRIVACEMSRREAPTFTVGFEGTDFDETEDVRAFLRAFPNLRGHVLRTTDAALEYAYPHALWASELVQPYTNGAAKWWLSRFSRRFVRGVLTGDGSDELFCGYPSYRYLAWWRFSQRHPMGALLAGRMGGEKPWESGLSHRLDGSDLSASLKALGWIHPLFEQVSTMAELLGDSGWMERERQALLSVARPETHETPLSVWRDYFLRTHFPTHVLNWVGDRMEMANSLEGRPVFLSRSVLEFARGLPDHFLVRGLRDKAVLRAAWGQELGSFSHTPKRQFNAPFLADGPLARELLSPGNVAGAGLVDPAVVSRVEEARRSQADPLRRSFASMLWQSLLAAHFLDRHLVRRQAPQRDLAFEEKFLDERSGRL